MDFPTLNSIAQTAPNLCDIAPAESQSTLNRAYRDRFVLTFQLPLAIKKILQKRSFCLDSNSIEMGLVGANIPSITIPALEVPYGQQVGFVSSLHRPAYSSLSCRFVVNNQYHNYYVVWQWLAFMNDPLRSIFDAENVGPTSQTQEQYPRGSSQEYQTTLDLIVLDEMQKPILSYQFLYAFPTNLGAIEFDYRNEEAVETNVDFQFAQINLKWLREKVV